MNTPDTMGFLASSRERTPSDRPTTEAVPAIRGKSGRWAIVVTWSLVGLVLAGVGYGGYRAVETESRRLEAAKDLPRRLVSRVDLSSQVLASGRVESAHKTIIECELERLEIRTEGHTVTSGGASTILEIIPEGTTVKKGDVLCRLDSSEYEEMVRNQTMKTEQSRAALDQARLSFEVAELAVGEYRDGLVKQDSRLLEGQIALSESAIERAMDRLRWTDRMIDKGYAPRSAKATAERTIASARQDLLSTRWDLANLREFGMAKTMKVLLSEVEKRRFEMIANSQRVSRLEERLEHYRKMVDLCTIRAPHDGFLIYSVNPWRQSDPTLMPGIQVRQKQEMFYLPDLDRMEIITYLHESVASRVRSGHLAKVRIESLPGRELTGKVVSIGPLPVNSPVWTISDEVKYMIAVIRLDETPKGLLPAMSAEVEIEVNRSPDVLAIPAESVAFEQGHDVCYVAGVDGLERRRITLGRSNSDLLEVTRGLVEGESVIMNPAKVESIDDLVVHSSANTAEVPEAAIIGSAPITVD